MTRALLVAVALSVLAGALTIGRSAAQPMPDVRGSAAYKREMAVEFAARALISAWQRAAAT